MGLKLAFWRKESGNLMSHGKGLTQEDIDALQSLKPGDRLILWFNSPKDESKPTYTLKLFGEPSQTKNEF
jgi:hypothetical protein